MNLALFVTSLFLSHPELSSSFQIKRTIESRHACPSPSSLFGADADDEITKQLERARELLAKSKAKIEAKELETLEEELSNGKTKGRTNGASDKGMPFFAMKDAVEETNSKREKVIKSKNEEGLFTTDGDLMAKMSEDEEWESRSLLDVFENESKDPTNNPIADRDVAASIMGLQKVLQTEDYRKIFDSRNRFIGEQ